jgi:hypothetical protein
MGSNINDCDWGLACCPRQSPAPKKRFFKLNITQQNASLSEARESKNSRCRIAGRIVNDWNIENRKFNLHLEILVNTIATLYLPAKTRERVFENGKHAAMAPSLRFIRQESNRAVYEVKSGTYHFVSLPSG